ncbi:MAG: diguanylate cyclase [Anaerolineales bacterium]|nr:diguanylate cyclase [Chloroflexota bacterium]MBL6979628.1 diguanylate cyclase [Anaerolineales bacterium]
MSNQAHQYQIMVVDDVDDNRLLLMRLLTQSDYGVSMADNGLTAFQLAEKDPPDLVLLDISMPEVDGYQVCQRFKDTPTLRDIPIIFISALDGTLDKEKAFSVGGVDYITKPIEARDVLMRVENHLSIRNMQKQLEQRNLALEAEILRRESVEQKLMVQATTDPLTKLYNRRQFFDLAERELSRAERKNRPICIILLDIDKFKEVNDTYGHLVGDQVLVRLAELCLINFRKYDIWARYGGEEFIAMLPETDIQDCKLISERLRKIVANTNMQFDQITLSITISMGISCIDADSDLSFDELLDQADQALYQSKREGRNRVTIGA